MALSPMPTTFSPDGKAPGFVINAYGADFIEVNGQRLTSAFILQPDSGPTSWAAPSFAALSSAHFEEIFSLRPEVVLLGTGPSQRFPAASLLAPFLAQGVGLEAMRLDAACRTYNILMAEGRKVVAGFLFL